jgi:hypothetical protein
MTQALEEAPLKMRLAGPALSRPAVANQRKRGAQQANAPIALRKPGRPLSMSWSRGPDGRLGCTWTSRRSGKPMSLRTLWAGGGPNGSRIERQCSGVNRSGPSRPACATNPPPTRSTE